MCPTSAGNLLCPTRRIPVYACSSSLFLLPLLCTALRPSHCFPLTCRRCTPHSLPYRRVAQDSRTLSLKLFEPNARCCVSFREAIRRSCWSSHDSTYFSSSFRAESGSPLWLIPTVNGKEPVRKSRVFCIGTSFNKSNEYLFFLITRCGRTCKGHRAEINHRPLPFQTSVTHERIHPATLTGSIQLISVFRQMKYICLIDHLVRQEIVKYSNKNSRVRPASVTK